MADYIPGLALPYRSSFAPTPPPPARRPPQPLKHARSQSEITPKTSKLTRASPEAVSPRRSQSHKATYVPSHTPAISSPLARRNTSTATSLSGQDPEKDPEANMPLHNPFRNLKERSSRIFRRNPAPAPPAAHGLQISAPSQPQVPIQFQNLLGPGVPAAYHQSVPNLPGQMIAPQQPLRPQLSMAQVAPRADSRASGNSISPSNASSTTKAIAAGVGHAARGRRWQNRQPASLKGSVQESEHISHSPSVYSREIDDGESVVDPPSLKRFSRAPQLPDLDFASKYAAEVVPSALQGSPEPMDQGEIAVERSPSPSPEPEEQAPPLKFRVDIHATSGPDFRATMSSCQQRVLSGGGTLIPDTEYLSGFLYSWPAHLENVLANGEVTELGGHIDVQDYAPVVLHPLRMHPYTEPMAKTSERVKAKMARSQKKLKEFYGLGVGHGSKSLGKGKGKVPVGGLEVSLEDSEGEEDQGEWEDIE